MADTGPFLDQALALVREAIEHDNKKEYATALNKYEQAIQRFIHVIKFEKNDRKKTILTQRATEYMNRAEQLKKLVSGTAPASPSAAAGGAATAAPGDKDAGGDAEKSKLRGALAGAIVSEKPNIKWDDVAGLEGAKAALKEAVILPVRFPQLFEGKRRPWQGILLYGPPGTGKSYLAKAVATEADSTFFNVSSSDLVSKWQGESERLVRNLFELARESQPSIVFIDEIDSLCSARADGENDSTRRIKTEFLVQMQGVGKDATGVLVLGATNIPWGIDSAMRRRFEKRVYIPLPEAEARAAMFKIHLGDTPNNLTPADFDECARASDGFSGSDISVMVREALMAPVRKCQEAQFFRKNPEGKFEPVLTVDGAPPCPRCPMNLSSSPAPRLTPCSGCGAERRTLMEVPGALLSVPSLTMDDFRSIMGKAKPSVSPEDLEQFEKWTSEFGEEGA